MIGSPGIRELVDHVAHARDVLEEEVRRIVEVDVRLRGAVDDELVGARHEAVGPDDGAHRRRTSRVARSCIHPRHRFTQGGWGGLSEVVAGENVRVGRHRRQELVEVRDREPPWPRR